MKKALLFILILSFFLSCKTSSKATIKAERYIPKREHSVQALLWQQQSAEYKALCHQAFNMAKMQLDNIVVEGKHFKRPLAIVTDIDETVLDNSPYNAKMVQTDKDYTQETWYDWGKQESAKAVPGALAFFNYAHKKGVSVYYLSNRNKIQEPETLDNLQSMGFIHVDEKHILLRTDGSGKELRRNKIGQSHQIIMLLGDNLSDFSELFDKQSTEKRNSLVEEMKTDF